METFSRNTMQPPLFELKLKTRRPRTSGIFSAPNLFEKDYWTTNLFLVDSFQHSNLRSLSKIWQKLHKNVKNRKILEFFLSFLG